MSQAYRSLVAVVAPITMPMSTVGCTTMVIPIVLASFVPMTMAPIATALPVTVAAAITITITVN